MKRWMLAVVITSLLGRVAFADDDDVRYTCRLPPPGTKLTASFKPEVSLADLVTWVTGFTCKNVIFSPEVAKRATRITIVSPNQMTPGQALQLFVDAVEATGLVVTQKADTIIIKLGPGMPRGCPDVASADDTRARAPTVSPEPVAEEPVLTDAELGAAIKIVDDTHRTITRALVDKLLLNPMALASGARIVPAVKNGKPDGFKLYAIRPGSVYAWLGLANGDTITSINKLSLNSADAALEVYTKLREAKQIEIQMIRRGAPVTLVITIK